MTRPLVYLAHPVGASTPAGVTANVDSGLRWLRWLRHLEVTTVIIAPWIASILAGDEDHDPAQRERGLVDGETTCGRCNGIVLVGGRVTDGMRREVAATLAGGGWVSDLTALGADPPYVLPAMDAGLGHGLVRGLNLDAVRDPLVLVAELGPLRAGRRLYSEGT